MTSAKATLKLDIVRKVIAIFKSPVELTDKANMETNCMIAAITK